MFSWICPQCGRDVPPSKTDCPYCAEQAALAAAGQQPGAAQQGAAAYPPDAPPPQWQQPAPGYAPPPQGWPPAPPQYAPPPPVQQAPPQYAAPQYPPQQYQPQTTYAPPPSQPAYAAPPQSPPHSQTAVPPPSTPAWHPPPPSSAPPTWLVALGFAAVLLIVGGGIYYFFLRIPDSGASAAAKAPSATPNAAATQNVSNPYQKYVEVVGLRLIDEDKKPVAKFVVVNHSAAEIDNLEANVRLWASTSRSEEDSVGSFSFKVSQLDANSSKDLTEPLKTKLKIYELPDWQNTTAEVDITSPTQ